MRQSGTPIMLAHGAFSTVADPPEEYVWLIGDR